MAILQVIFLEAHFLRSAWAKPYMTPVSWLRVSYFGIQVKAASTFKGE